VRTFILIEVYERTRVQEKARKSFWGYKNRIYIKGLRMEQKLEYLYLKICTITCSTYQGKLT